VHEVALPASFGAALAAQRVIMHVEVAAFHDQMFLTQRDQYGPRLRESIESGHVIPAVEYLRAQRLRRLFQQDVEQMLRAVDVLLTPATPTPAPRNLNTTGDARFQSPWTYAGVPAIAIPSGLSQDAMPMGIQLIAPARQEEQLLRAARWCERTLDVTLTPPI
jgi:aspartyl-tRNA(Asn)/glutamyl-tRNA(Gln) amidotransferase subunit A